MERSTERAMVIIAALALPGLLDRAMTHPTAYPLLDYKIMSPVICFWGIPMLLFFVVRGAVRWVEGTAKKP